MIPSNYVRAGYKPPDWSNVQIALRKLDKGNLTRYIWLMSNHDPFTYGIQVPWGLNIFDPSQTDKAEYERVFISAFSRVFYDEGDEL